MTRDPSASFCVLGTCSNISSIKVYRTKYIFLEKNVFGNLFWEHLQNSGPRAYFFLRMVRMLCI